MEIAIKPPNKLIQTIKVLWLSFLLYVVIGGALGFLAQLLGYVGSFCADPSDASDVYRTCESCELYFSVFGVIEIYDCDNAFAAFFGTLFIVIPRVIIACLAIFIYPLVELLDFVSRSFTIVVLVILTIFVLTRIFLKYFYKQKNIFRRIHRASLFSLFLFGACLAIMF